MRKNNDKDYEYKTDDERQVSGLQLNMSIVHTHTCVCLKSHLCMVLKVERATTSRAKTSKRFFVVGRKFSEAQAYELSECSRSFFTRFGCDKKREKLAGGSNK